MDCVYHRNGKTKGFDWQLEHMNLKHINEFKEMREEAKKIKEQTRILRNKYTFFENDCLTSIIFL